VELAQGPWPAAGNARAADPPRRDAGLVAATAVLYERVTWSSGASCAFQRLGVESNTRPVVRTDAGEATGRQLLPEQTQNEQTIPYCRGDR